MRVCSTIKKKIKEKENKKWNALLCGVETATQRLRAFYVTVPTCGHNAARRVRATMVMTVVLVVVTMTVVVVVDYPVYSRVYVHPRQTDGAAGRSGKYT